MPGKRVKSALVEIPEVVARPTPRYSALARTLADDVRSGRYRVGECIPTEAQLQQRFDVSRHTVREALRELKSLGLVFARQGVGTIVSAPVPRARFLQGIGTLTELVQFAEATRMRLLGRRELIADEGLAEDLAMKPGQQWHEATVLRFLPDVAVPVASLRIYVRPEHCEVLDLIERSAQPVFGLIERRHGVRIVEVDQQIVAVSLASGDARLLKARPRAPALRIARQYYDAQRRLTLASVGIYPSDRFRHDTKFRIQNPGEETNR
jgi:GntR family transcriptional regulator